MLNDLQVGDRIQAPADIPEPGPVHYCPALRRRITTITSNNVPSQFALITAAAASNANDNANANAVEDVQESGDGNTPVEVFSWDEVTNERNSFEQQDGYDPLSDPMFHDLHFYDLIAPCHDSFHAVHIRSSDELSDFFDLTQIRCSIPLTGRSLTYTMHSKGRPVLYNANCGEKRRRKMRTGLRRIRQRVRRLFKLPNVSSVLACIPAEQIVRIDNHWVYFVDPRDHGKVKRVEIPYRWPRGMKRSTFLQGGTILGLHAGLLLLILGTTVLVLVVLI